MTQDNREYISKARVQNALLDECKLNIIQCTIAGCIVVPLMVLITSGVYALSPNIWPLWGFFIVVTVGLFYVFFIEGMIGALCNRRLIVRGDFHVEQDYARRIDDDEPTGWDVLDIFADWLWILFWRNEARYIHFAGKRRFIASKRTREHATAGDLFYLVVLNNRKNKIAYIYNSRYYRLEEC